MWAAYLLDEASTRQRHEGAFREKLPLSAGTQEHQEMGACLGSRKAKSSNYVLVDLGHVQDSAISQRFWQAGGAHGLRDTSICRCIGKRQREQTKSHSERDHLSLFQKPLLSPG